MGWARRANRAATRDSRIRRVGRSARGAIVDTAIESAKEGIGKASEKVGKVAGAGLAVAATAAAEAVGHRPGPLIAVGAAYVGMKVGGLAGKAMNAGLDRVTGGGRGGGPIGAVLTELSSVLQLLKDVETGIAAAIDSVNQAQAHFQRISTGAGSNLLTSATRKCRGAPRHLADGLDEVEDARNLVGQHLVAVATAGTP